MSIALIYTLSLHDALPIFQNDADGVHELVEELQVVVAERRERGELDDGFQFAFEDDRQNHDVPRSSSKDRKSTRLNSSHPSISYAVFCLKKKYFIPALLLL